MVKQQRFNPGFSNVESSSHTMHGRGRHFCDINGRHLDRKLLELYISGQTTIIWIYPPPSNSGNEGL